MNQDLLGSGIKKIEHEFNEHGICKFRSNEVNLSFFVPTYGCPEMVSVQRLLISYIAR